MNKFVRAKKEAPLLLNVDVDEGINIFSKEKNQAVGMT